MVCYLISIPVVLLNIGIILVASCGLALIPERPPCLLGYRQIIGME